MEVTLSRVEFGIGSGSMWSVKAGESCVVRNGGKKAAILHVSILPLGYMWIGLVIRLIYIH